MTRCAMLLSMLVATCTAAQAATNAYIKLTLDSTEVFNGDMVVLDVESTGLIDPIDLAIIEQHTTLLRETTGTRIAVIGGRPQGIAIRRMDLLPKRTGVIVIGPLIAGDVVSNSVHIKVLDAIRPDWTPQDSAAQIITTVTPEKPVVNQQVLFTVELRHRYPINSESITLPDLNGFSKRPLIENRRTFTGDNKEWFRTEWQTLIYPRRSGTIAIDSIEWSGTLAKSNVERAAFARSSNPIQIRVDSAPDDSTGWWLPSKSVRLSESWSSPPTELRAGDELERTITVIADNVLAGQIPIPDFPPSRALKQVLINTSRQETVSDKAIQSSAAFTYRVTAQSPIPVFLDTVRVPWWDTNTRETRESIIPARRINVGLPDRADVLSKLALEDSRMSQVKHRLQSTQWLHLISVPAALVAIVCLLWWLLPAFWKRLKPALELRKHIGRLKALANSGDAQMLYRLLQTRHSKALLKGCERPLVARLENLLFHRTDAQTTVDADTLKGWLQPVTEQVKRLPSIDTANPPEALARL